MSEANAMVQMSVASQARTVGIVAVRQAPAIGMTVSASLGGGSGGVADKLATARKIALAGDALGDALFDGSQDVAIYTAVEKLTNLELEEMLK